MSGPRPILFLMMAGIVALLDISDSAGQDGEHGKLSAKVVQFLSGKWEPASEVQKELGRTPVDQFYEFKADDSAKADLVALDPIAKKLGLRYLGFGWLKRTSVAFTAGQETSRSTVEGAFAICGNSEGYPLLVWNAGTAADPKLRNDYFVLTVRGNSEGGDLFFLSNLKGSAIAFRRAMVRLPAVSEKK